jgi:hypothetical protein
MDALDQYLPTDVVDDIAAAVHRMRFADCQREIKEMRKDVVQILHRGEDLREHYPDMRVYVDSWATYHTVIVELAAMDHYVFYHSYNDAFDTGDEGMYVCEMKAVDGVNVTVIREDFTDELLRTHCQERMFELFGVCVFRGVNPPLLTNSHLICRWCTVKAPLTPSVHIV